MGLRTPSRSQSGPNDSEGERRTRARVDEVASKVTLQVIADGVLITGLRQNDGTTSDGVSFVAGQTIDIPHGLGRSPRGFIIVDATGSAPSVFRTPGQPQGTDNQLVRLTHSGSATTRVKFIVY